MSERNHFAAAETVATRRGSRACAALAACGVALAAGPLSGCVDPLAPRPAVQLEQPQYVRRPGVSIAGASVAFVSIDGPPAAIATSFADDLAREAAAQDIVVVDAKKARYFVRGYFSAYATADGAAIQFVWDVFNKDRQRAQRLSDVLEIKGEGADPWRAGGDAALARLAAHSAGDLAAFLSNTPEAGEAPAPALAEGKPMSFAPLE
jgi:hypothetical protein